MQRTPILLITDLGRDIDDTIALMTLIGLKSNLNLVGIVTSGGNCLQRAALCRMWMRYLNVPDSSCMIAPGPDDLKAQYAQSNSYGHCGIHGMEFSDIEINEMLLEQDSTQTILKLASRYGNQLVVLGVGPLTPLAEALQHDHQNLLSKMKSLYLMGILKFGENFQIEPNHPRAYNFREDKEAADLVFERLRNHVPFTCFGGWGARKVSLTPDDYMSFHRDHVPMIEGATVEELNRQRMTSPDNFYSKYEVPEKYQNDETWQEFMISKILAHPYDALLVLAVVQPELFEAVELQDFHNQQLQHKIIGNYNQNSHNGVLNPEYCRLQIRTLVNHALDA